MPGYILHLSLRPDLQLDGWQSLNILQLTSPLQIIVVLSQAVPFPNVEISAKVEMNKKGKSAVDSGIWTGIAERLPSNHATKKLHGLVPFPTNEHLS